MCICSTVHVVFGGTCSQVESILRPLALTDDDYRKVMMLMLRNMERGLAQSTNADACIKMYPTYVRAVPDGTGESLTSSCDCSVSWTSTY